MRAKTSQKLGQHALREQREALVAERRAHERYSRPIVSRSSTILSRTRSGAPRITTSFM
jgi:hypothetical protein